jgi:hypothetical protein
MSVLRNIRMILSLSCAASSRLLSDRLDRALSRTERTALLFHLLVCHPCRQFRRNLRLMRSLVHHMTEQNLSGEQSATTLAPDERARILETVTRAESEEI